ncbi:MAG: hypothetical protein HUU20_18775 [Pirellulales bacterium]|nr:hypothetical protein [Pirellulales bacterium]
MAQRGDVDSVTSQTAESTAGLPAGANLSAADYPSIQAALDALPPVGGRVFVPAGT